jgi:hypothetical protein
MKPSADEECLVDGFSFFMGAIPLPFIRHVQSGLRMIIIDRLYQHEKLDFLAVVGFKLKGLGISKN